LHSAENFLFSSFFSEDFRCPNRGHPGTQFKDVYACLYVEDSYGTASSHPLSHIQRPPTSAIVTKLKSVYETEVLALFTVKKWRKLFAEGRNSLYNDPRRGRPLTNDSAEAVSSMLKERACLSCKVLCRHVRIAKGTYLRIRHDTLGMKKFYLRWVPHATDINPKVERIKLSHGLLLVLQSVRSTGFQSVNTRDKSWRFLNYPRDRYGRCHEMKLQKESVKKWTQKSA
jgi:hypothetical protein